MMSCRRSGLPTAEMEAFVSREFMTTFQNNETKQIQSKNMFQDEVNYGGEAVHDSSPLVANASTTP